MIFLPSLFEKDLLMSLKPFKYLMKLEPAYNFFQGLYSI